jgi:hypothetical protein
MTNQVRAFEVGKNYIVETGRYDDVADEYTVRQVTCAIVTRTARTVTVDIDGKRLRLCSHIWRGGIYPRTGVEVIEYGEHVPASFPGCRVHHLITACDEHECDLNAARKLAMGRFTRFLAHQTIV